MKIYTYILFQWLQWLSITQNNVKNLLMKFSRLLSLRILCFQYRPLINSCFIHLYTFFLDHLSYINCYNSFFLVSSSIRNFALMLFLKRLKDFFNKKYFLRNIPKAKRNKNITINDDIVKLNFIIYRLYIFIIYIL